MSITAGTRTIAAGRPAVAQPESTGTELRPSIDTSLAHRGHRSGEGW
jgi:hypothetical protein